MMRRAHPEGVVENHCLAEDRLAEADEQPAHNYAGEALRSCHATGGDAPETVRYSLSMGATRPGVRDLRTYQMRHPPPSA